MNTRLHFVCLCLLCISSWVRILPAQDAPAVSKPAAAVPPAATVSLAEAEQLYRKGKFDAAAKEYNSLIEASAQPALAYAGLTRVYIKEKKAADAYAAAEKAMELSPDLPEAHAALGEAYFREGRLPEAEKEFVTLIRARTLDARAYLGMALLSRAASLYAQAKRLIDYAHQLDPEDPDIQRFWLSTLSLQDRIKGLKDYLSQGVDDAVTRGNLQRELAVLQDEAAQPSRSCKLTTNVSSTKASFKPLLYDPNHLRGYGLNVELNGTHAALLLDTGASGILVDRKIAEKAGIKRIVQSSLYGIGDQGAAAGYVGYADSIQIGDLKFQDCYVDVIERNSVLDDDGLIGANVFSQFLIDLDFSNGKFGLSELPARPGAPATVAGLESRTVNTPRFHDRYIAPEMKAYWPVYRFGHDLLIPTKLNDSPPKLFLIDSGAFNKTISPEAAREVTKVSSDSNAQVKGLNGSVKNVFRANELILTFANMQQRNLDMVAFDTSSISNSDGTEVSGILGFAMLRVLEIKIDYRDGLVDFSFDPHRWR